mgnify:CR=1 FL=1
MALTIQVITEEHMRQQKVFLSITMAAILTLASPKARAEECSKGMVNKISTLNNRALQDCINNDHDKAKGLIQIALTLTAHCPKNPETARSYLLLGVIELMGSKRIKTAEQAWLKALAISPDLTLPAKLSSPSTVRCFERVKKSLSEPRSVPPRAVSPHGDGNSVARKATRKTGVRKADKPRPVPDESRGKQKPTDDAPPRPTPKDDTEKSDLKAEKKKKLGSWKNKRMPRDPALYGLGNRLVWSDFKKAKKLRSIGSILLWVGAATMVASLITFGGAYLKSPAAGESVGLLVSVPTAGVGGIVLIVGGIIASVGASRQEEAGVLIFKTRKGKATKVSLHLVPNGGLIKVRY